MITSLRLTAGLLALGVLLATGIGPGCHRADTASSNASATATASGEQRSQTVKSEDLSVRQRAAREARRQHAGNVDGKLFTSLSAEQTGIGFQITWDKPAAYDRIFYSQNTGGGVSVGDYDNDGLPDIYLTSPSGGNRLYRNLGELRFEDATQAAGLHDPAFWGTGATFVDIDNDGNLDLDACS